MRVCPVRVPCTLILQIDAEGWPGASISVKRISLKHLTLVLAENRCSNSLYTRNCATVLGVAAGPVRVRFSVQGTNVNSVLIGRPVWKLGAPSKKLLRIRVLGQLT